MLQNTECCSIHVEEYNKNSGLLIKFNLRLRVSLLSSNLNNEFADYSLTIDNGRDLF